MTPIRVRPQSNESETKRKTDCVLCTWSSVIGDPKLLNTLIENRWKINSWNFQKDFEKNLQHNLMWLGCDLKLRIIELSQYLDGWPPGNTRCRLGMVREETWVMGRSDGGRRNTSSSARLKPMEGQVSIKLSLWNSSALMSPTWHFWPWYVPAIFWVFKLGQSGSPLISPKIPITG